MRGTTRWYAVICYNADGPLEELDARLKELAGEHHGEENSTGYNFGQKRRELQYAFANEADSDAFHTEATELVRPYQITPFARLGELMKAIYHAGKQRSSDDTDSQARYVHRVADLYDFLDETPIHELMSSVREAMEEGVEHLRERYRLPVETKP